MKKELFRLMISFKCTVKNPLYYLLMLNTSWIPLQVSGTASRWSWLNVFSENVIVPLITTILVFWYIPQWINWQHRRYIHQIKTFPEISRVGVMLPTANKYILSTLLARMFVSIVGQGALLIPDLTQNVNLRSNRYFPKRYFYWS